jgi:putative endonuclease
VIATNQYTPLGELDLVCRLGREVVIVEVKARTGDGFGTGLEAIGPRKVQRLRASAMWWLSGRGWLPCRIRFDAVVVGLDAEGTPRTVLHIPDLVAEEGL